MKTMRTPDTQDLIKLQEEKRCLQEQLEVRYICIIAVCFV